MNPNERNQIIHALNSAKILEPYEQIFSIHSYFMLVLNSILFCIAIYYINMSKFKANHEFRPLSIYLAFIGWLLSAVMSIVQPVSFYTIFGGFANGYVKNFGPDCMLFQFWITWACILQISIVYSLTFLLQFSRMEVLRQNWFLNAIRWFDSSEKVFHFLNFTFIFHLVITFIPIYYCRLNLADLSIIYETRAFMSRNPSLHLIKIERNFVFELVFEINLAILCLETLLSLFSNYLIHRSIKSTSYFVNPNTLKAQMTVYKIFTIQILLTVLFFYSPILITLTGKVRLVDDIFMTPLSVVIMNCYFPCQFIVSYFQFPALRRTFSHNSTS